MRCFTPYSVSFLLVISSLLLNGCGPLIVAGTAATGATLIYDQRSWKTHLHDEYLKTEAMKQIQADPHLATRSQIIVESFNSIVLLAGESTIPKARQQIQHIIARLPNVRRIYNEIKTVNSLQSSKLQPLNDSWLATKVKSQMMLIQGLRSSQFKIVALNGTIYLLGLTDRKNGEIAADIARRVPGVTHVVKLLEYI